MVNYNPVVRFDDDYGDDAVDIAGQFEELSDAALANEFIEADVEVEEMEEIEPISENTVSDAPDIMADLPPVDTVDVDSPPMEDESFVDVDMLGGIGEPEGALIFEGQEPAENYSPEIQTAKLEHLIDRKLEVKMSQLDTENDQQRAFTEVNELVRNNVFNNTSGLSTRRGTLREGPGVG